MKLRMIIMLIIVGVLFGAIFIWKAFVGLIIKNYMASNIPIATVSTVVAHYEPWQPTLEATGSLRAIRGVDVTTQLAGMVKTIMFKPGQTVTAGTPLVQLVVDTDIAQLRALEANAELARLTYERDKAQYAIHAISKAQLDQDAANLKNTRALVAQQAAVVAKKTIVAPFSGRLGIVLVNPGQFLTPGDKVVSLQTTNPIYADFYLPQQVVGRLQVGQRVIVTTDSFPGKKFFGKLTTINPAVEVKTRNIQAEATIANPDNELVPGMFAGVMVITGEPQQYLTLPQTAVSFNPYGELVYLVRQSGKDNKGKPILTAIQSFVKTGDKRGDQVVILEGLKEGEVVVSSGQIKLKNNSRIAINNSVQPANNPNPSTPDEY